MLNDSAVTVVGDGVGACAGWTYLYDPWAAVYYWLEDGYLSLSPPVAGPSPSPVPAPTVTPPGGGSSVIETCINGAFQGWTGDTLFELCNGQVWVQSAPGYLYHYAYRPDVTIVQAAGGWEMSVEGVNGTVRVSQTTVTRTCIDGTFEGWSGSTVFELCNGEVWQQSELGYNYAYRFRPSVLIYWSPSGGYRMQVDGESESIGVRRIFR
jgi:hypothetical protein